VRTTKRYCGRRSAKYMFGTADWRWIFVLGFNFYLLLAERCGVAVLSCPATTASDPPICTDGCHSTNAGCQAGTGLAWSWQWRTGRRSSQATVCRLQSVLNASARLICRLRRSEHITAALISRHWLYTDAGTHPIQDRCSNVTVTYKVFHDTAP